MQRLGDVMQQEAKVGMLRDFAHVLQSACGVVVHADDAMTFPRQAQTEICSEKARSARDQYR